MNEDEDGAADGCLNTLSYFLWFLCICCVFCAPSLATYSREELVNIGKTTSKVFSSVFINPVSFTELLVGGAAAIYGLRRERRRHRGKRAGALVRLRQQKFCTFHLANVRSLANKMDKLLLLNTTNMDLNRSAALCFTQTWLGEHIPDTSLHLPGFHLH